MRTLIEVPLMIHTAPGKQLIECLSRFAVTIQVATVQPNARQVTGGNVLQQVSQTCFAEPLDVQAFATLHTRMRRNTMATGPTKKEQR